MADYNKIGLLILSDQRDAFLVCEKDPDNMTSQYIMPGGQFHESTHEECLVAEIQEELSCEVDRASLRYIEIFTDIAAGTTDKTVSITLYSGNILGTPVPTTEIKALHWIGIKDIENPRVSAIIRNKIVPFLLEEKILLSKSR